MVSKSIVHLHVSPILTDIAPVTTCGRCMLESHMLIASDTGVQFK